VGILAIKSKHYDALKHKVYALLNKQASPKKIAQNALTQMRLRWDIYWADIYWASGGVFTNASEYHYLNDNHIDSALKAILRDYIKSH